LYISLVNCDKSIEKIEIRTLIGTIEYFSNDIFCEKVIDLSEIDLGVHLLLVTIEGKVYTKKVIIL
jgi:hypothetical protein